VKNDWRKAAQLFFLKKIFFLKKEIHINIFISNFYFSSNLIKIFIWIFIQKQNNKMAQYNKQNLLLNQWKTKLNTKEIGDLYEIKIMEKFHPDHLYIFSCTFQDEMDTR